jgi:HEAT repeat protein
VNASATSAAAIEAAETLSYVRDPVAVPYLARLLDNGKNVEWLAVYGLERVADISAVDALISQLNSRATETNSRATETRMLALAALRRIEETTSDPTIRQRIEGARR